MVNFFFENGECRNYKEIDLSTVVLKTRTKRRWTKEQNLITNMLILYQSKPTLQHECDAQEANFCNIHWVTIRLARCVNVNQELSRSRRDLQDWNSSNVLCTPVGDRVIVVVLDLLLAESTTKKYEKRRKNTDLPRSTRACLIKDKFHKNTDLPWSTRACLIKDKFR